MKEALAHIASPQAKSFMPFFQRSEDKAIEDNAFFSTVQAKLNVGSKDDPYEKEADAMADQVVKAERSSIQTKCAKCENEEKVQKAEDKLEETGIQEKLAIGKKDDVFEQEADAMADKVVKQEPVNSEANKPSSTNASLQNMLLPVQISTASIVQSKCAECEQDEKMQKKEDEGKDDDLQRSPVKNDANNSHAIQRMCRECDEGKTIFRSVLDTPNIGGMSKRDGVIAMAKSMLGKIKAKQEQGGRDGKPQRFGADQLWEIFKTAAPGVWSEDVVRNLGPGLPSWCGIFSVWAHKKAGIDLGNWQMGRGVSAFGTLKQISSPQAGDIGYIDQPYQHHCIVTKVNGSTVESIDGNSGLFSEVIENVRPVTAYSGFFTAFSGSNSGDVNKKDESSPQAKSTNEASPAIETSLASSKGAGNAIPNESRNEMESGLGADFSGVKIHTDSSAVQMSRQLNAQAFTHGNDVYFNENKFDPDTSSGKHLLAHELTHTVQQGAAPQIQQKAMISGKLKATDTLNRKANVKSADVDISIVGNVYEIKIKKTNARYLIDLGKKEIEVPGISLPGLKERNSKLYKMPILSVRGRGETLQVENWVNAVKSAINARVHDFLLKENPGLTGSETLFYKLKKKKDFHLIGNVKKIQELNYIPNWGRLGLPNNHQVDHIVEFQLGGADQPGTQPENYELLDAKANMSSGNAIRLERYRRMVECLGYFNDINAETAGKFPNLPSVEQVKEEYICKFGKVIDWKLPYNGNGKVYWTHAELTQAGAPMKHLEKMSPAEVSDIQGSAAEALIYVGEGLGTPKRMKLPFAGKQANFFSGIDLENFNLNSSPPVTGTPVGTIEFKLNQKFTKKLKTGDNLSFNLMPLEGRTNTFYIKTTKQFNKNLFTKFEGLSPVTVNGLQLDETHGLMLTGNITCDVPLLKELSIDFFITGEEMGFSTLVNADIIRRYFPKPFKVTDVYLEISYSSKSNQINLVGNIDFEVEKLGKGSIKGGKKGEGFMVYGDFKFDKSLFDGQIHFNYEENKWAIGGKATIDGKKIKGVKRADIKFDYTKENINAGGTIFLTMPGVSEITVDSTLGKDGTFNITTSIELSKIPRVKGGKGTLALSKDKEGNWDVGVSGKVVPDMEFGGLKFTEADISYAKGIFDFKVGATYNRNRLTGEAKVGITNKPVAADGKTAEGEGSGDMKFYGLAKLNIKVTDDVDGDIETGITPDGDISINAKIEVKEDKKIFEVPPVKKNIFKLDKNIPLASCVVITLSLHIGGAVDLYAAVDPLSIKKGSMVMIGNLSLKNYQNPVITSKLMLGSHLKAGIILALEVGLDASLLGILHAQIGGRGTLDFVALEADAIGIIDMGWSGEAGFKIIEASVSLEMTSKLIATLNAYARVYVDLWLTTINIWDHDWELAREEFKIALFDKKKMTFPVMGPDNKMALPKVEEKLSEVEKAGDKEKVATRVQSKLDGQGQTDEDKQAEVNELTKAEILKLFTRPDRFEFNRSEDYIETRYNVYYYLKDKAKEEAKVDLSYLDAEIIKCELEEYDAFTTYIMADKSFDDNAKGLIIEDFINNHPTLGSTEVANLKSLIVVPVPAAKKPAPKKRPKAKRPPGEENKKGAAAPPVQKKELNNGTTVSNKTKAKNDTDIETTLSNIRGSGNSMPDKTRQIMETAMNADFRDVRLHTGSEAATLSDELGARAFTRGNDVYFNHDQYNPDSQEGKHLLAHELTHTVQQKNGGTSPQLIQKQPKPSVLSQIDDELNSFNTGEEEVIALCARLTVAEKAKVIAGYKKRFASALNVSEMIRALSSLNPQLNVKLEWVDAAALFTAAIDYSEIRPFIIGASQLDKNALNTASWKDFFVSVCDNASMKQAVIDLHFDLEVQLDWLDAETAITSLAFDYADIKPLIITADQAQKDKLNSKRWKGFFVSVCDDATIRDAVTDLHFPLEIQLDWLEAEAFITSWSYNYADIKPLVTAADQAQKDALKSVRWQSFFIAVCDNSTIVEAVTDLHFDLETQLEWVKAEATLVMLAYNYSDIKPLITSAAQAQKDKLKTDYWRGFFIQVCTNKTIVEAVADLGFDLSAQLDWVLEEGTDYLTVKAIITANAGGKAAALANAVLLLKIKANFSWDECCKIIQLLGRVIPDVTALLGHATVLSTLSTAWTGSTPAVSLWANRRPASVDPCNPPAVNPPVTTAHEEGGWVYLNVMDGTVSTQRASASGGQASINLWSPPDVADSVIIATFHTHPNIGHCWSTAANPVFPSTADTSNANKRGVPNMIRGAFPDIATTIDTYTGPLQRNHVAGISPFPGTSGGIMPQPDIFGEEVGD